MPATGAVVAPVRSPAEIVPLSREVSFLDSIISPPTTAAVQRRQTAKAENHDVPAIAARGIEGAAEPLPFMDQIQQSFGAHDVTGIQAHAGGDAAEAAAHIGAEAYATGNHVAFARTPDLHTAAHEAAHVVQQRAGVQLKGGVGEDGDPYERHADAVADAVVRGESAEPLLGDAGPSAAARGGDVQRRQAGDALPAPLQVERPEQAQIIRAVKELQTLEDRAEKVWRDVQADQLAPEAGCTALTAFMGQAIPPVVQFGALMANQAHDITTAGAASESLNPFERSQGASDAEQAEPISRAVRQAYPEVVDSLNNLVRLSLETMRLAAAGDERRALASTIDALSNFAAPLAWTRPASVEDANTRRFAHEACPDGAMDERPDNCTMTDAERAEKRSEVRLRLAEITAAMVTACANHQAELNAMIEDDRALGQFIGGIAVEVILTAVSGGGGGAAAEVAGAEMTSEAAKSAVRRAADIQKIAGTFGSYASKVGTQSTPNAGRRDEPAEQRTIAALAELQVAFAHALEDVRADLEGVDDLSLRELVLSVNLYDASLAERRVAAFVSSYRSQIEPLGSRDPLFLQSQPDQRDLPGITTFRAARITPLTGGTPRLAQIRHVTDALPSIRAAGRALRGAATTAIGAAASLLTEDAGPPDASTTTPAMSTGGGGAAGEEYYFVCWIDADLAASAAPDALDLGAWQVRGVPWFGASPDDDDPKATAP